MNKNLLLDYDSPTTQLINLRIESGILTVSGDVNAKGWTGGQTDWWTDPDYDD